MPEPSHSRTASAGRADGLVEFRSYKLKPGSGSTFHDLVVNQSMPLLREHGTEVVAFGQSADDADDPDAYFLVRAYDSLDHRRASQGAFYSSVAWTSGPRRAIVDLIDTHWDVVVWLTPAAVDALRSA
jgi:NIPSNAP